MITRQADQGELLERVHPVALTLEIAKAGPDPEAVLEATYGWYWANVASIGGSDGRWLS